VLVVCRRLRWRRDSHRSGNSRDETHVPRHIVDAHVYRDALRQSDPGENGVNGRKPLHVWLCIRDVDSSRDAADMSANGLPIAHQEYGCRIAFANRAELVFFEVGVHPKRIGIDKRDFTLSNIGEVLSLSKEIRHPSIKRRPNLRALEIYARLT
jgi:hypothetical protein